MIKQSKQLYDCPNRCPNGRTISASMRCPNCGTPLEPIPPDKRFLTDEEMRTLSHDELAALLEKRYVEAGPEAVKAALNGRLPIGVKWK